MIDQKKRWQIIFRDMGFYSLAIDGDWGKGSHAAHQQAMKAGIVGESLFDLPVCFSNKVSPEFNNKVIDVTEALKMNDAGPDQMMACMGWESGETFSPSIRNGAGSGATGLIQHMPSTAIVYFYSKNQIKNMTKEQKRLAGLDACDRLSKMTAVEQLDYVYKYFEPYAGRLETLADVYMAILYPVAIGKPLNYVLFDQAKSQIAYRQNIGIDMNKDGLCTKGEAATKVKEKMIRGFKLLK